jgi:hypothetical protein
MSMIPVMALLNNIADELRRHIKFQEKENTK